MLTAAWEFRWDWVLVPLFALLVVGAAKWVKHAFEVTLREVVRPDIKAMGAALGKSLDELREQNTRDHHEVQSRLTGVEASVAALDARLSKVEALAESPYITVRHKED